MLLRGSDAVCICVHGRVAARLFPAQLSSFRRPSTKLRCKSDMAPSRRLCRCSLDDTLAGHGHPRVLCEITCAAFHAAASSECKGVRSFGRVPIVSQMMENSGWAVSFLVLLT